MKWLSRKYSVALFILLTITWLKWSVIITDPTYVIVVLFTAGFYFFVNGKIQLENIRKIKSGDVEINISRNKKEQ